MDPIPTPTITVSFAIDLDLKYDPFKGKSPVEFAALIEDDLHDALMDLRPEMIGVLTSITSVHEHNV
jgi:hypothetical protein